MKIRALPLVLASFLLILAGACSRQGADAKRLSVCTSLDEDEVFLQLVEFKRYYPDVKLDVSFIDEGDLLDALNLPEEQKPDIAWGFSTVNLEIARKRGLLRPFAPDNIEKLSKDFYDGSGKEPHWVGMRIFLNCFASGEYSLNRWPFELPYSYEDLLQAKIRNGIIMPDPLSTGTGFMFVSVVLQEFGEDEGWKYLEALDKGVEYYTSDPSGPVKDAGCGDCSVGISFLARGMAEIQKGAPILVTVPDKVAWTMEANALVEKSRTNPAAKAFLDWAVSATMMRIYARKFTAVALEGMKCMEIAEYTREKVADARKIMGKNDIEWASENKERILAEWKKRFGSKLVFESQTNFKPLRDKKKDKINSLCK